MEVGTLASLTICKARDLLLSGEIFSKDLVEATLQRISETEPHLHAYTTILASDARRAAIVADKEIRAGRIRSPLHGIPLAIKDLFYTKNIVTEGGSRVLEGFKPAFDSTAVKRLKDAGAVLVGKTVTHEFGYGQNLPPTRNAWRQECYPGGSSAGSAVAVAARSAFGAIGTDTGGSVRIPASFNGIVAIKPTFGRISRHGTLPLSPSLDTVGPMARSIEDCAIMLEVLSGYDPLDPASIDSPVPQYSREMNANIFGLRIGVERDLFFDESVVPDVRGSVEAAIAELKGIGATVINVEISHLDLAVVASRVIVLADASTWLRRFLRESIDHYAQGTRRMLLLGELILASHYVNAQRACRLVRDSVRQTFRSYRLDALIAPSLPMTAVKVDEINESPVRSDASSTPVELYVHHCVPANAIGIPALSLPCGFGSSGLPIGLQIMGPPMEEATLLRIGRAYEKLHGWGDIAHQV